MNSIQTQNPKPRRESPRTTTQGSGTRPWKKPHTQHAATKSHPQHSATTCSRCGKENTHSMTNGKCPAIGAQCSFCNKRNHWHTVCKQRLAVEVHSLQSTDRAGTSSETDEDCSSIDETELMLSINTVKPHCTTATDKWSVPLNVGGTSVTFCIDTGARCNVMVKDTYDKLPSKRSLEKSSKALYSYSNHRINSAGTSKLTIKINDIDMEADSEIVDLKQKNAISGDLAEELGLIQRVSEVKTGPQTETKIPPEFEEFPDMAKTTGTLPGTYTIKIEPGTKGVAHPVRRQPATLRWKIEEKLKEMERDDHLARVEEPTEWVSSMVVSLKKDKVRICIDPKDLNRAIRREHYPMRTVEEIVSKIAGSKVFSVLDAKSGFLQIKLYYDSSLLTTFNTPIGRFRWLRLPFGIKCAPEIYQRIMDQMLEGIHGATAMMDDILIAGTNVEHHDQILRKVIERATSYNLKLNFDNCRIRQRSVPYVGHIITENGLEPDLEKVEAIRRMPTPQSKGDIKRFLVFIGYLSKFIPILSAEGEPLRALLKYNVEFTWQNQQEASFEKLKELCC